MKGGRVFQTMGIKKEGERVSNVTRIITSLNDDFTVHPSFGGLFAPPKYFNQGNHIRDFKYDSPWKGYKADLLVMCIYRLKTTANSDIASIFRKFDWAILKSFSAWKIVEVHFCIRIRNKGEPFV